MTWSAKLGLAYQCQFPCVLCRPILIKIIIIHIFTASLLIRLIFDILSLLALFLLQNIRTVVISILFLPLFLVYKLNPRIYMFMNLGSFPPLPRFGEDITLFSGILFWNPDWFCNKHYECELYLLVVSLILSEGSNHS